MLKTSKLPGLACIVIASKNSNGKLQSYCVNHYIHIHALKNVYSTEFTIQSKDYLSLLGSQPTFMVAIYLPKFPDVLYKQYLSKFQESTIEKKIQMIRLGQRVGTSNVINRLIIQVQSMQQLAIIIHKTMKLHLKGF